MFHAEDDEGKNLKLNWTINDSACRANQGQKHKLPDASAVTVDRLLRPGTHTIAIAVANESAAPEVYSTTLAVVDTTPPNVACPPELVLSAGATGQAAIPNVLEGVVAWDNATPESSLILKQIPAPGTAVGLGTHIITVTATDGAGLTSSCLSSVTVQDTTPPTIVCPPGISVCANLPRRQAVVPNVLEGVASSDNCTPENALRLSQQPAAGTMVGVGTHTIRVLAADAAGNRSQGLLLLTVKDASCRP